MPGSFSFEPGLVSYLLLSAASHFGWEAWPLMHTEWVGRVHPFPLLKGREAEGPLLWDFHPALSMPAVEVWKHSLSNR